MRIVKLSALTTFCGKIAEEIKRSVFGGKAEASMYFASGVVSWFRYNDGQVYEIIVSPAENGKFVRDFARMKNIPGNLDERQLRFYIRNELNTDTQESVSDTTTSPLGTNPPEQV